MDMQVQLEWKTRIGPGRDRNWAQRVCEKRGKRERGTNQSTEIDRETERGALSSQAAASLLFWQICTGILFRQLPFLSASLLSGQDSPHLTQPSPGRVAKYGSSLFPIDSHVSSLCPPCSYFLNAHGSLLC
jgi:hypothetical protein